MRELFEEKLKDFDLIILDRFRRRAVLPPNYYNNIANYVRNGGALLVAAGPEFGGIGFALSRRRSTRFCRPRQRVRISSSRSYRS